MNKNNSEAAKLSISREAEKSALDCEQPLFYPKLFKWEYLSSEVARVASAQKQTNTRPRNFALAYSRLQILEQNRDCSQSKSALKD